MDTIRHEIDADGIAWVTFDDPAQKVNVFSTPVMNALDAVLDQLAGSPPRGVIFISGKPDGFIAGADLKELAEVRDAVHARELSEHGQRVFERIAGLTVPTVAAIHGACLGGGCELALACAVRVATQHPKTQLGLPETQLGIIPGWGGTQRLPRLVGVRRALPWIVAGQTLTVEQAQRGGLVDAVVPVTRLRETARQFARGERRPVRRAWRWENAWPARPLICHLARRRTRTRTADQYPAPLRAIDAIDRGLAAGKLAAGLAIEAGILGELAASRTCRHLVHVFFLREKYAKLTLPGGAAHRTGGAAVRKVGVLGAGLMGAGIAQWCSARGCIVRLKDIKPEFVAAGLKRIATLYRDGVRRRKLTEPAARLGYDRVRPTTEYSGFETCDVVIEAVVEKLDVKRQLLGELAPRLRADCLVASNTSAIPIDDLAVATGRPERVVGLHFFNPVHRMPLVEVVRGTKTSAATLAAAVEFVKQLQKIPVVVRGTPGFLVNRVLMPYLNEAGLMVEEGVPVAAIDEALRAFGMPMGPLRLLDEIGIAVALEVGKELAAAYHDRMSVAPILLKLHNAGLRGRSGGAGFYVYDGDCATVNRRVRQMVGVPARTLAPLQIQRRLLRKMINEARLCLDERVVESEDDIDAALIFGTGFPPFRGGLVQYARDVGEWVM